MVKKRGKDNLGFFFFVCVLFLLSLFGKYTFACTKQNELQRFHEWNSPLQIKAITLARHERICRTDVMCVFVSTLHFLNFFKHTKVELQRCSYFFLLFLKFNTQRLVIATSNLRTQFPKLSNEGNLKFATQSCTALKFSAPHKGTLHTSCQTP